MAEHNLYRNTNLYGLSWGTNISGDTVLIGPDGIEYDLIDYPLWPIQESVAAGQTAQVVEGSINGIGDVLGKIDYVVNTADATATLSVQDGTGTTYTLNPTGGFTATGPGSVSLGYTSISGAWKVTTGAGLTAVANLL